MFEIQLSVKLTDSMNLDYSTLNDFKEKQIHHW